jgi:pyruvate formate lyase activating enzyme
LSPPRHAPRRHPDRGLVFDVQRYSLHDGSGIRTVVFMKGCPLRCAWCSNPEGQTCAPQLAYDAAKCIGRAACGEACQRACEVSAIHPAQGEKVEVDLTACTACGSCVPVCPSLALELLGEGMSVEDVLERVERDGLFFARSGGGVTLSGGEPLLQADFSARLLEAARERGIHTALETSGSVPWSDVEKVCRHADQVFYDVKCLDAERHRQATGVGNGRILENLRRLRETFPDLPVVVRTPVVPGVNDSPDDIRAICEFLRGLAGPVCYELLPYHRLGEQKYRKLGMPYPLPGIAPPAPECMAALRRVVEAAELAPGGGASAPQ